MTSTEWLLVITVIIWAAFDVWIGITRGAMSTISVTIWLLAQKYPVIPLAVGILLGHLFVPMLMDCIKQ